MTRDELEAAWTRYMHRADLEADLGLTYDLAGERVAGRLMRVHDAVPDEGEAPGMWLHAGLWQLHELAQDDAGAGREATLFEDAARNFMMAWSLANVTPQMRPPAEEEA